LHGLSAARGAVQRFGTTHEHPHCLVLEHPLLTITWCQGLPLDHPFFRRLPTLQPLSRTPTLDALASLLAQEAGVHPPGGYFSQDGLSRALLVATLRHLIASTPGYPTPLTQPAIYKAIQLMHADPGAPWTVPDLAGAVGMSRSAFYRAFQTAVSQSPGDYLSNWRVICAKRMLRSGYVSVIELADRLGYSSAAAFSRAFKSRVGQSPRHWATQALRTA